jgi:uncharacterized protein (TIGR02996 family)
MTDDETFEAAIEEVVGQIWPAPGQRNLDPALWNQLASGRLVYADWLEERGEPRAAAQRWLAEHAKLPRDSGNSWDWWSYGDHPEAKPEDLPRQLWDKLPGQPRKDIGYCKEFGSRRAAERALFKALAAIEAQ